jgi:hypothetical protein
MIIVSRSCAKRVLCTGALSLTVGFAVAAGGGNPPAVAATYGELPLSFEANEGQSDARVRFLSHGEGYSLFLSDSGAVLSLAADSAADQGRVIRMEFIRSGPTPQVSGESSLPGKANYFVGQDPSRWHTNIPTFSRVKYTGVYPGVDLVYYGDQGFHGRHSSRQGQLEYDFLVAPGADPRHIRFRLTGADAVRLRENGDLVVAAGRQQLSFGKPAIYQDINGQRKRVRGAFTLLRGDAVGFRLGSYDHRQPLIIDPVLVYSTYVGGSGGSASNAIAVDASGYAYIAGIAYSADFPVTPGGYQTSLRSKAGSAFVCKMNQAGTALVYCTFLGGSNDQAGGFSGDTAYGLAIDSGGNAYVAGQTTSTDFPITSGAAQTTNTATSPNNGSSFITKLNPSGSALVYSTFLNGAAILSLAIDSAGSAYATGDCWEGLAVTAGAFQTRFPIPGSANQQVAPFVTKLNAAGSALAYSTYLGGTSGDVARQIAVDASGDAFVVGTASSTDFPVTSGAYQTTNHSTPMYGNVPGNAFVAKLNPGGSALVYATYLGGSVGDDGVGVAIDGAGDAFVTGSTQSTDFPVTPGALQTIFTTTQSPPYSDCTFIVPGGEMDAFVSKLNPAGSELLYSTYLAGSGTWVEAAIAGTITCSNTGDAGTAVAADGAGNAYVTGSAASQDFPVTALAYQPGNRAAAGSTNLFITKLNPAGNSLVYSTYLGGSSNNDGDAPTGIALDASANIYVTGSAQSTDFPVTPGAFQTQNPYVSSIVVPASGFISKLAPPSSTLLIPKVAVTPTASIILVSQSLAVAISVTGTGPTPTGTVTLTSGSYASASTLLVSGKATIIVPANALVAGVDTLTAKYTPNTSSSSIYSSASGTASESVAAVLPVYSGGQLSLPAVSIGNASYTDMVVTIASIVSGPSGTSPRSSVSSYDPATGELTVPAVTAGATTYYNVVGRVRSLVSIGSVAGADVYDGIDLDIAYVEVGPTVYDNVVVKLGRLVGLAGGMPAATLDQYDAISRQLLIPSVEYGGKVYTNVTITVGTIVSVNGGPP